MNKIAKLDPVSGPLSREELKVLCDAPFGKATERIREFDPFFGRKEGEKIRFKVECRSDMNGTAYVEAANQEEADDLADNLTASEIDWDYGDNDFEIVSVEPDIDKRIK